MVPNLSNTPPAGYPDSDDQPQRSLFDVRTLVVLLVSGGAGWLAYYQGGWQAAVLVTTTVMVALHRLTAIREPTPVAPVTCATSHRARPHRRRRRTRGTD